ncbi:MAG: hypothetical protein HZB79_02880 [Deltaproteobacteria bacterium]|nr:hypothetical protein [Deltaproteobacteria bacterium]
MNEFIVKIVEVLNLPSFVAAIILSFVFIYSLIKKKMQDRETVSKEKINFLIDKLTNETNRNTPFILEQIFLYRFGRRINDETIKCLLDTNKPTFLLGSFLQGERYLQYSSKTKKVEFKNKFSKPRYRKIRYWIFMIGYIIFFYISIFMLMMTYKIVTIQGFQGIAILALIIFSGLVYAYLCIDSAISLKSAEKVVKEFSKKKKYK